MLSTAKGFVRVVAILMVACTAANGADVMYEEESMEEPYSYFLRPSTVVGFKDCREATQIWPDIWGRMVFFTGEEPHLLQKRIKTLHRGYLPIVQCSETRDGVLYGVQAFGATLSGKPEDKLIMFVKIWAKNETKEKLKAFIWAGADFDPPRFTPDKTFMMKDGLAIEDNQVLYIYDGDAAMKKYATLDIPYTGQITAEQAKAVPSATAMCLTRFDWELKPGETKSAYVKVPNRTIELNESGKKFAEQIKKAEYKEYFGRTVKFWEDILAKGAQFQIPHEKTHNLMRAGLQYLLIARNKIGDDYIQFVSKIQFPRFFFRDSIFIQRSYDLYGHPDFAGECIRYIQGTICVGSTKVVKSNRTVGARSTAVKPDVYDRLDLSKYGHRLWNYCEHFLFTGDKQFAKEVMPEVRGLINWIEFVIARDPMGIIPISSFWDGEFIWNGHRMADNFWMLAGLRAAKRMGRQLDNPSLVQKADSVLNKLQPAVVKAIEKSMKDAGYISGAMERWTSPYNNGWGEDRANLCMVWPSGAVEPNHPSVTATIDKIRSRYEEGITGHYSDRPGALFLYRTLWVMQQELARGNQEQVVKDLYAIIAHTGSTQAGYEAGWGSREGIETHGWFWARYISFIRNMLVREEWDDTLHILSTVPAEWAKVGNKIGVTDAPTHYGNFSFTETIRADGADIKIKSSWRQKPKAIVLHLPYFADVSKVVVDGKEVAIEGAAVQLAADTKNVKLFWKTKPAAMAFTYAKYLKEFRKTLKPARLPVRSFYYGDERLAMWEKITAMRNEWYIIGPFNSTNRMGFDTVYPPEKEINLKAEYKGKNGMMVKWQRGWPPAAFVPVKAIAPLYDYQREFTGHSFFQTTKRYAAIDFKVSLNPNINAAAYAYTNIFSPKKQKVKFVMSSNDTLTVWVNDARVHENFTYSRGHTGFVIPDQDNIEVDLNQGWNSVLVKVCQGRGGWGFCLRVTDMQGNPIEYLRLSPEKQK